MPVHGACAIKYRLMGDDVSIAAFEEELAMNLRVGKHDNVCSVVAEVRAEGKNAPLLAFCMKEYKTGSLHDLLEGQALCYRTILVCLIQVRLPCKNCCLSAVCVTLQPLVKQSLLVYRIARNQQVWASLTSGAH